MTIAADEGKIAARQQRLAKMLKPLCRVVHPEMSILPQGNSLLIILGQWKGKARETRYASRAPGYFLNYFESWESDEKSAGFHLDKAYFHLDKVSEDGTSSEEVIALHCDPRTPKDDKDFIYKSGPHMHFSSLPGSLGKGHVAMCLDSRDRVCRDVGAFDNAMARIVQLINVELIARR